MVAAGIGINYFLDPRLARATWVFPGLTCFSVAAVFGTLAHLARLKALKNRRWGAPLLALPLTK